MTDQIGGHGRVYLFNVAVVEGLRVTTYELFVALQLGRVCLHTAKQHA